MTFTLSPPVRYAALLGLLAAVLVGGGTKMLGGGEASLATPHRINHHPFGSGAKAKHASLAPTVAAKKHAVTANATAAKPKSKPKAASKPVATVPTPIVNHPAVTAALKAGLPAPVANALGQNATVVVGLYDPYSKVDAIAFAEARAGAKLAGVGFLPLNVLSKAQVGKLTELLGLLPDPGLLVYVRPGSLVAKISGFADKETVAQAAQNAAHGS
ncbi:MAG TPA: hypothetical protein VF891_06050 [Gaiellaceae bacterium]